MIKKIKVIDLVAVGLLLITVSLYAGLFFYGWWGVARFIVATTTMSGDKRNAATKDFLVGQRVLGNTDSFNAFYAGERNGKLYFWTLGGLKNYLVDRTQFVLSDSCSQEAVKYMISYGMPFPLIGDVSESVWRSAVVRGGTVKIRYDVANGRLLSVTSARPDIIKSYGIGGTRCD